MTTSEKIILAVLVIFAVLMWLMPVAAGAYIEQQERKKRGEPDNSKARYDERQKLIRLEAGTHALYALGGYLLLWMVLEFLNVPLWEPRTLTLLAAGLLLAMVVWNSECILRGAVLGFNQRKNESGQIIMYVSLGLCWLVMGCSNLEAMPGSPGAMQMLIGVSSFIQGGLMLYARHRRKLTETQDGAE